MLRVTLLLHLLNSDEQVSIVVVPPRLDLGLVHHIQGTPEALDLLEDGIHLFEGSVGRLGEEEVDRREHDGVDDGKDDVCVGLDVLERRGRNHDDQPVKDPVRAGGEGVGRGADSERSDLGGIQPGHAEPANGEEGVEDEEEHDASDLAALGVTRADTGEDGHGDGLAGGAEKHKLATTNALDEPDGRQGGDEVLGTVQSSQEKGHVTLHSKVRIDGGGVVCDQVDTAIFLLVCNLT